VRVTRPTKDDNCYLRVRQGEEVMATKVILDEDETVADVTDVIDKAFEDAFGRPLQWHRVGKPPGRARAADQ